MSGAKFVTRTLFTLRNLIITLWRKAHRKLANWIYKRTTAFATIFLPQELVDIIIDYLADENDLNALRSCSLTSRCWVYRAQYHIHRRVTVRRYNNAAEPDTDWYSSARVAQLVQHLFLDTLPLIPDGTPPFPTMDHLWDTIFRFPCVTDLSISNGWWDYTEQERNAFGSHFRNLRSLSLCGIILPDQDTFLELIGEFPRLKSLAINPITFNQPKGEGITLSRWLSTVVPGSSIDHLTIGRGFSTILFEFLLQWLKVLSKGVHDGFTLQWQASLNIQVLPGVLRCLGTSLSQLSLDLHGIDRTILPDPMESLGCTQLRTLTFDGIFLDVFSSQKRGFAWIPDFLGALDPLQLVSVTFRCILEDRNDIFAFPFLELDEALSHEDFRSLSRVTFVVCGLYTLTQSVIYKFMDMPRLKDRGLLRLEWGNY